MLKINKKSHKIKYNKFLHRLTKTKSLHHMSSLIEKYISDGNNYIPTTTRSSSGFGDCNGDGNVNVLDIVKLVNFVLGDTDNAEDILNNCCIRFNEADGELNHSGEEIPNILDIVSLVNFILYQSINEIDDDFLELDLVIDDTELIHRVYGYQWGQYGYDYDMAFGTTNSDELTDEIAPYEFAHSDYTPTIINRVLITAPHSQRVYRPTSWNTDEVTDLDNNPSNGLSYCTNSNHPSCHKAGDTCTGAMAKALSEISGAPYLTARGKQEDPNYYDILGIDLDGYVAESNIGSGNSADPAQGYYGNNGLQTELFLTNTLHPFKTQISNYLNQNPQIKLVIDLHGSSSTANHWDIDIGLLGNNGIDGTMSINEASIGNNTIDYSFLSKIVSVFYSHNIGLCNYTCAENNLGDCEKYSSDCPDGITGHGPISFNDFAAVLQDTVTKYVNLNHNGVQAIQLEAASIYRCLGSSDENDVVRYMRSLQELIHEANIYYAD